MAARFEQPGDADGSSEILSEEDYEPETPPIRPERLK
jgi:hypothetical protein